MTDQATSWLSLASTKIALRVAEANHDHDDLIVGYIVSAVDRIERETGLPLLTRMVPVRATLPPAPAPVPLPGAAWAEAVRSLRYWRGGEDLSAPPPHLLTDTAAKPPVPLPPGAGLVAPGGQAALRLRGPYAISPPTAGWPPGAVELQAVVDCGLHPADYPALSTAVEMLVRDMYEGTAVADRNPYWRRLIEPVIEVVGPSVLHWPKVP